MVGAISNFRALQSQTSHISKSWHWSKKFKKRTRVGNVNYFRS